MSLIVSSIVGGVNEQNSIVKNVRADDSTAKRAIERSFVGRLSDPVCYVHISYCAEDYFRFSFGKF